MIPTYKGGYLFLIFLTITPCNNRNLRKNLERAFDVSTKEIIDKKTSKEFLEKT